MLLLQNVFTSEVYHTNFSPWRKTFTKCSGFLSFTFLAITEKFKKLHFSLFIISRNEVTGSCNYYRYLPRGVKVLPVLIGKYIII